MKKIFLLRPVENHYELENDPWRPWYDKCFGLVVRAENEKEARSICVNDDCDLDAWLDPKLSTCIELDGIGDSEIIIKDVHNA